MKLLEKLKSRKFAVAAGGMAVGMGTDNPVMSIIIGAVYILAQSIVDAVTQRVASTKSGATAARIVDELLEGGA